MIQVQTCHCKTTLAGWTTSISTFLFLSHTSFDVQVKGFPTLMLVDGKGDIKSFEGDRTKEGLVKFIEENSVGVSSSAVTKEEL